MWLPGRKVAGLNRWCHGDGVGGVGDRLAEFSDGRDVMTSKRRKTMATKTSQISQERRIRVIIIKTTRGRLAFCPVVGFKLIVEIVSIHGDNPESEDILRMNIRPEESGATNETLT